MNTSANDYAQKVVKGKIVAGPHVRNACKRHLNDLKRKDIHFDAEAADRWIRFFETRLKLNGGKFEGKPFKLLPDQKFIVGSLFGWMKGKKRRFRKGFIEEGKGNGKSPLAAGIGIGMLMIDGEARAEVYSAAVNKDQAKVLFRDALAMRQLSPAISKRTTLTGGTNPYRMNCPKLSSWFETLSTENTGKGKSGYRPHCGLLDEVHEHKSPAMVEFIDAGQKWREQPLTLLITNSGSDRTSVCWDYHVYAVKVAAGDVKDDTFFSYVCALDEGDDPFHDEKCWIKANPSLGKIIGKDYLRRQVREARGMPSKENIVRRLNFCQWTEAEESWLGKKTWLDVEVNLDWDEFVEFFKGRRAYGALDLGAKRDMTSLGLVVPVEPEETDFLPEGGFLGVPFFWTPGDTLQERVERDRAPYDVWERQGFLEAPPGQTINYRYVAQKLGELAGLFDFTSPDPALGTIAFDRWHIDNLLEAMNEEGVDLPIQPHGQGFRDMSPAVVLIEEMILNKTFRVLTNEVLRWNVASVVMEEDAAGNRKFSKRKATGRIDGIVAMAMAVNMAYQHNSDTGRSVYEDRGLIGF